MGTYRKKPVIVEAWQITDEWFDGDHPNLLHEPFSGAGILFDLIPRQVVIETLEGEMVGEVGDWIIRGVEGEFYPCKPSIFAATYEKATP